MKIVVLWVPISPPLFFVDKRRLSNVDLYCEMRETALPAWVVASLRRGRGRMAAVMHTFSSCSPALASLEGHSCASRFMIVLGISPMPGRVPAEDSWAIIFLTGAST